MDPRFYAQEDIYQGAYDGAIAVPHGAFMFFDADDFKPASSMADALTEALNQRNFARRFAGVCMDAKVVTAPAGMIGIARCVDAEYDCVSATYAEGDLVTVDEAASGTALENLKLVATTDASQAIGEVLRGGTTVTRIRVRLNARAGSRQLAGRPLEHLLRGTGSNATQAAPEALSGDVVLTAASAPILRYDPGGAGRNIDLPAPAGLAGFSFIIQNYADAAEVLTVRKTSGGATVVTPTQNETAIVWCDGVDWEGIVGARN